MADPLSANFIAEAMVERYYRVVRDAPNKAYAYYRGSSVVGRPDPATKEMVLATTLQAIHDLIMSFSYTAEVSAVYAQDSYMGGVMVVVAGFLTGDVDNVKREFTQAFFLVKEQTGGYFIHNDVLQLKDAVVDKAITPLNPVQPSTPPRPVQKSTPLKPVQPSTPPKQVQPSRAAPSNPVKPVDGSHPAQKVTPLPAEFTVQRQESRATATSLPVQRISPLPAQYIIQHQTSKPPATVSPSQNDVLPAVAELASNNAQQDGQEPTYRFSAVGSAANLVPAAGPPVRTSVIVRVAPSTDHQATALPERRAPATSTPRDNKVDDEAKVVFLRPLPEKLTRDELTRKMKRFGLVNMAEIRRNTNNAVVEFVSSQSANDAAGAYSISIHGLECRIERPKPQKLHKANNNNRGGRPESRPSSSNGGSNGKAEQGGSNGEANGDLLRLLDLMKLLFCFRVILVYIRVQLLCHIIISFSISDAAAFLVVLSTSLAFSAMAGKNLAGSRLDLSRLIEVYSISSIGEGLCQSLEASKWRAS
ncbi:hypothetical protein RJ640_027255 [Escallonia rubra]|uniref:NTF2 domain-containing protein n=1 Tax=Escallonia rubra TaxID=112253 RepID=A0AA88RUT0_9ASTE|nr:hypothetical protein RJ640_027255 [Escallonia rubra]